MPGLFVGSTVRGCHAPSQHFDELAIVVLGVEGGYSILISHQQQIPAYSFNFGSSAMPLI